MAQHDYIIENQPGAAFREDLNRALDAIVTNNSGATEPATPYPFQWWADTTAGVLKQRNAGNNDWNPVLTLATGNPVGGVSQTGPTGAILVPEGNDAQRPAEGGLRGNTESLTDYFLEVKNKVSDAWEALAARPWVKTITDALAGRVTTLEGYGKCVAWVNFDGTGVVAIRASQGVLSVTDNGIGSYSVHLMSSVAAGFATLVTGGGTGTNSPIGGVVGTPDTATSVIQVRISAPSGTAVDQTSVNVAVFR